MLTIGNKIGNRGKSYLEVDENSFLLLLKFVLSLPAGMEMFTLKTSLYWFSIKGEVECFWEETLKNLKNRDDQNSHTYLKIPVWFLTVAFSRVPKGFKG